MFCSFFLYSFSFGKGSLHAQKCDREQPCGLCKTRGVEHLCRWELEPFARPPPARPPASLKGQVTAQKVDRQILYEPVDPGQRPGVQGTSQLGVWQKPQGAQSGGAVDQEVKEAAIALAQLSVARQGEYLGAGSLVCALYKVCALFSRLRRVTHVFSTSSLTRRRAFKCRWRDHAHHT